MAKKNSYAPLKIIKINENSDFVTKQFYDSFVLPKRVTHFHSKLRTFGLVYKGYFYHYAASIWKDGSIITPSGQEFYTGFYPKDTIGSRDFILQSVGYGKFNGLPYHGYPHYFIRRGKIQFVTSQGDYL